jgi:hypothetical protein
VTNSDSYELPQRVHTAKTYPLQSRNGSTIIIYAQESGVKIIWRGGKPFKSTQAAHTSNKNKANGSKDDVMILDSDDEAPAEAFVDTPEFEDQEEEYHSAKPYPSILQVLDLYFGTDVLDIAVLPASILNADGASWRVLDGLKQKIVFAAACADHKVRLITLPLAPPSPTSKARPMFKSTPTLANVGNGSWGETVGELIGHNKIPTGVSITVDIQEQDQSKAGLPHFVVASHSREVTGSLLLFRIPISLPNSMVEPFQTSLLSSPARSISFNPSLSSQRMSQLLVADSTGACRIYDFKRLVKNPEDMSPVLSSVEQGSWLLSLYPGFPSTKNDIQSQALGAHAGFGRKTIIDAKWVSGGKAIMVLLCDGQWAVWDIEGVGRGSTGGLLGRQGFQGGSCSEYALSGYIEGASKARTSAAPQIASSKFAPMTPGTRKSTDHFGGKISTGPAHGQISVAAIPSTSPTNPTEESIAFWFGDSFTLIPNFSKFWSANARKANNGANLFNGTPGGRMVKLDGIDLQGERCTAIDQLVKPPGSNGHPSNMLILGEHRFIILEMAGQAQVPAFQASSRMALVKTNTHSGELDVVGIDQALTRLDNSNEFGSRTKMIQ